MTRCMKRYFLLLLSFFLMAPLYSQVKDLDLGIDNEEWIDKYMLTIEGVGSNARDMLEVQSVKSYMMPVRRVPPGGSELSYVAATLLEFYINQGKNYKVNLSPDYISLNLLSRGSRVTAHDAFGFLAKEGTVSAAILPYGAAQLNAGVYATNKYRIDNYFHLFRPSSRSRQKVFEVRKALMRGNPVMVELKASPAMQSIKNQRHWDPLKGGDLSCYFVVVGYDEKAEAFELMSAWGDTWADHGYIWVSYNQFSDRAENAYVLIPNSL
jgi:hypothetical protein